MAGVGALASVIKQLPFVSFASGQPTGFPLDFY